MTSNGSAESGANNPATALPSHSSFPIVGIGASAGGVQALIQFFEHTPQNMGMAFVVILHLSAEYSSHADEILQRSTGMVVQQVTEATAILENHVYVIAPGKQLWISNGHLHVGDRETSIGVTVTIDQFFRTLANAHGEHAIGIVLSGTGSDGAAGLSEIKGRGGIAMAQEPSDAEYPEMPQHAITTGQVDIVLPVTEMPQKLLDLWSNAQRISLPVSVATEPSEEPHEPPRGNAERTLQDILMHLRVRTGHDFRHYKRATVLRRIERRMQVNGVRDLDGYRNFLRVTPDETTLLLADMLIGVTQFFRDRDAFDELQRSVIPGLFRSNTGESQVRVWVAGCSTGEEAYSLSMLLAQARESAASAAAIQIFATDIDDVAIARARTGAYPASISTDVPHDLLRRFFTQDGSRFLIAKTIRERILFATHSLLRDPPFSHLDLISCRNVMIYLDRAVQRQILELFHFALRPDGHLFLGTAESADAADDLFSIVDKKNRIYRAKTVINRSKPSVGFPSLSASAAPLLEEVPLVGAPVALPPISERRNFSFSALHQRVLEEYAPPSVIVDRDSRIVHLSDTAGRFLRHAGGEPSTNIMEVVVPELRLDLRTTLFRALQTGVSVEARRVKMDQEGRTTWVNMIVRPFHDPGVNADFFLVLFDEVQERMTEESEAEAKGDDPVLIQLEHELQQSREQLATTIEQYETSVEELKASNEELQAINEELRSATEELESSKEELQSVNEELTTVNAELQARVEDTAKANDDLQNIIVSTEIATVFVDKKIQVKRFTPSATSIFKLIETDLGRSLFDITHSLLHPTLAEDVQEAFQSLKLIEREVQSQDGKWYLMRLLPYRTADDRIDGAVLTLIDITARHEAEEQARIGEQRLRLVAQSTADYAIIVQDPSGCIVTWNAGAERIFGYTENEVVGKNISLIYTQDDRQDNLPERERQTAARDGRADDERWHVNKDHRRVYCSGVVTPISDASFTGYAKIARDMTDRKQQDDAREDALAHEQTEREKASRSSQLKDDFIAVLSHELRHPLNLIGMKAEMLPRLPETRGVESVREAAQQIRRAVHNQAQIIDDLLDLSRVRTGKVSIERSEVDLAAMLRSVADVYRADAQAQGIDIDVVGADAPVIAYGDPVRCEQILWNLVSNATKYSHDGGRIELRLSNEGAMVRVDVIDTGEGIEPAELEHVFDMFRQGPRLRSSSGLGIGLALVRQLVEMHGGRVAAHSEGAGRGTMMSVWLPAMAQPDAALLRAPTSAHPLEGMRALIVESDREVASALARLLELEGAEVVVAPSRSDALDLLGAAEQRPFNVMVAEFFPHIVETRDFVRNMRGDPRFARLKTIAVTDSNRADERRAAFEAGFDAQMGKPVDVSRLLHVLVDLTADDSAPG
ncbi:two-component system, chemotaxis family, CheB/CheR fusion protein [Pararobbsia alpina]|uniref:CheR family methyltransferase n=1 Tax=Pararobbsia alpina TaxID=621374 RepID=UPI0039A6D86B